ncbi:MAG: 2,5-dihydroxypyridine 5,6-dioxygenase [Alphaproteobacteria bacterium]|nr:2,5-dihydroxypyridine 5,6-dioxygenase [Alphaproteobacteria bacterium]
MRPQLTNPAKLASLFRKEFELSRVKAGETIAVLTDLSTQPKFVEAAFAAAADLGADIYSLCVNQVPSWHRVGISTVGQCKGTLEAFKAADMLVCLHVPLFTKWMKDVRKGGTRVLMVIDHPDDLESLMSPPGLKEAVIYAGKRLESARTMRITNAAGTDFTVKVGEYPTMIQYGYADEPGRFDHWGGGHVHTFPNEGTANGSVVIQPGDLIVLPYNRYVTDQIRLEIHDGFVRKIEGGLDAKLMSHWLDGNKKSDDDFDGHAISHLGWGLNPNARWDNLALWGDDPERTYAAARTFAGNFLFSTGPNNEGGGKRSTTGHYDVPMRDCTVMLDNEVIIDRGRLKDPKMIVPATTSI